MAKTRIFFQQIKAVPLEKLVFLDEAGFQATLRRSHAWAKAGVRAACRHSSQPAKNITVIGAIRLTGPVVMKSQLMAMTSHRFTSFLRNVLAPKLHKGDVLVMDNLRAHHSPMVKQLAEQIGLKLIYTPPYTPQYNPIELAWAVMKQRLRYRLSRLRKNFRYAIAGAWRKLKQLRFHRLFASCKITGPKHAI